MRIVSAAPSVTTILTEIGAEEDIVAATDYCDIQIDVIIGGWASQVDMELIKSLKPDIVFTVDQLQRNIADDLRESGIPVFHTEPNTIDEFLESIPKIGEQVGRKYEANKLKSKLETRIRRLQKQTEEFDDQPVIYCEEWPEPPMVAGNWIPEIVNVVGGKYPYNKTGQRSRKIKYDEVVESKPDYVVLHYCGWEKDNMTTFAKRGWDIDAEIAVVDDDLFNQPSPKLVEGIKQLALLVWGKEKIDIERLY